MLPRARMCVLVMATALACKGPAPAAVIADAGIDATLDGGSVAAAWPELPRDAASRRALLARLTVRAPLAGAATELADVLAAARARRWSGSVAGEARVMEYVDAWLARARAAGRDAYLLFGVRHDSGAPVAAFGRLVGPGGARGWTHVTLEQLAADGRWGGVAAAEQRGDSRALAAYLATGTRESFAALARAHDERDYTAWKFDYAGRVLDVAVTGRASQTPTLACDMPKSLQRALTIDPGQEGEEELARLRELHCLFALGDAPPAKGPRAVAMIWGSAHVGPQGMRRWLPKDAAVLAIRVHDRVGAASHVALGEPILVPLEGDDAALLLPDPAFAVDVDRIRDASDAGAPALRARASRRVRIFVDGAESELAPEERTIAVPDGPRTLVVDGDPLLVTGLPRGTPTELDVDPAARRIRVVVR
jgi:hypothetical protein